MQKNARKERMAKIIRIFVTNYGFSFLRKDEGYKHYKYTDERYRYVSQAIARFAMANEKGYVLPSISRIGYYFMVEGYETINN
jgi:hypothetical protein